MKHFFATVARNQPFGCGYFEVVAVDRQSATEKANRHLDYKWSMLYDSLDQVHELDRKKHGTIY